MFTDKDLKRMKLPRKCNTCAWGLGFYKRTAKDGFKVSMSLAGLRMGFATQQCPECKADPAPDGRAG